MSVSYSMKAGYGFLLEELKEALEETVMEESQGDDLKLFDIVDEFTLENAFILVGKIDAENSLETCSIEIVGDRMNGETYSIVAFLNNYESFSLDGAYTEEFGARLFDDEIPVSKALKQDIEKMKKYFRLLNDEPKPIVAISIS